VRFFVMLGLPCDSPQRTGCTARRACQTSNAAIIHACGQPWLLFVNTTTRRCPHAARLCSMCDSVGKQGLIQAARSRSAEQG